eukprot:TRINITY_DN5324_c0_g1_i1.p2 TRINITY_DN5324_c0_g1~~TRINITY_DN5324_c0_g1_i1.p2  ORF type:complete len:100 (-),score=0.01 TRINITY_DN5324_c0_g1_i1:218-517(-)
MGYLSQAVWCCVPSTCAPMLQRTTMCARVWAQDHVHGGRWVVEACRSDGFCHSCLSLDRPFLRQKKHQHPAGTTPAQAAPKAHRLFTGTPPGAVCTALS